MISHTHRGWTGSFIACSCRISMRSRNESNEAADWQCIVKLCTIVCAGDNVRRIKAHPSLPALESHHNNDQVIALHNTTRFAGYVFLLPLTCFSSFFVQFILILFYHIIYVYELRNRDWSNRRWGGKMAWSKIEHKDTHKCALNPLAADSMNRTESYSNIR